MKASDILLFDDLKTKTVTVKQWKRDLTLRELGLNDGLKWLAAIQDSEDSNTIDAHDVAMVVARGVIDAETGERIFSDDDISALAEKSSKALMFLYQEIIALSSEDAIKN